MFSAQETKPCKSELRFLSRILETDVCLKTKKKKKKFQLLLPIREGITRKVSMAQLTTPAGAVTPPPILPASTVVLHMFRLL